VKFREANVGLQGRKQANICSYLFLNLTEDVPVLGCLTLYLRVGCRSLSRKEGAPPGCCTAAPSVLGKTNIIRQYLISSELFIFSMKEYPCFAVYIGSVLRPDTWWNLVTILVGVHALWQTCLPAWSSS
jgi:hypothetical protein